MVPVEREACGGCFNHIPPQRQLEVKLHNKVIVCEYCGRVLIDPDIETEPVEEQSEAKADTKKKETKKATAKKTTATKKTASKSTKKAASSKDKEDK